MIDLTQWNITLPIPSTNDITKPLTIKPVSLQSLDCEHFSKDDLGHLHFYVPDTGMHTANSSYPRSELRGCFPDGSLRNWRLTDTPYKTLSATLALLQLPTTGKVILGQIHTKDDTGPMLKIVYDNGKLQARIRKVFKQSDEFFDLAWGVQVGELITYTISIYNTGVLNVSLNRPNIGDGSDTGKSISVVLDNSWTDKLLYFKAGVYSASNAGGELSASRAVFCNIDVDYCLKEDDSHE